MTIGVIEDSVYWIIMSDEPESPDVMGYVRRSEGKEKLSSVIEELKERWSSDLANMLQNSIDVKNNQFLYSDYPIPYISIESE